MAPERGNPFILLIDGPSGAGKTTLARAVVAASPAGVEPVLIRLDDVYRGWNGLASAAPHLAGHLLRPLRETGRGRWQRYDWEAGALSEWHEVDASRPLIVEGTGALTAETAPLADLRVWVEAEDAVRKPRAIARQDDDYADYWDMWQAQYERHLAADDPRKYADLEATSDERSAALVAELAARLARA
ncbi:ATP-binding protein [Gryllotalpicola sp.]|uniref:ATP-binding protein n=1 Tax=Gryllotalpicola sp. TaxID=1932787 RepID=UPI00260724BB|nr:ATP-binding protein [Gryllotalpicola sp.]